VQLAYNEPRCRVLVFRKSRLPVPLYTNHTTDMILCVFRYRTNGWNWYALALPPHPVTSSSVRTLLTRLVCLQAVPALWLLVLLSYVHNASSTPTRTCTSTSDILMS
jgi:hypothetical protein